MTRGTRGARASRSAVIRLGLALALVLSPATTRAQGAEASPEDSEWHLTSYGADGSVQSVPWFVDATLLLADGSAVGYTGCNRFTTAYDLDGAAVTFEPTVAMTLAACPDPSDAIEQGFMAGLSEASSWTVEDGVLTLSDSEGDTVLEFEQAVVALTSSDVAALRATFTEQQAQIDRLDERLDSVRIGLLRERIRTLEDQVQALRAQGSSSGGTSFSRDESALLRGIPAGIRQTCVPLRGDLLPRGTLAAVQCKPRAAVVSEMAYYLMPYDDAERTFRSVMRGNGVPRRFECSFGRASQMLQSPYHATGCFVDGSDQANVRLVTWAAECHELDVGGRRIGEPAVYIAIESARGRIKPLYEWATNPDEFVLDPVWTDMPHGGTPRSPGCRGLAS